MQELQPFLNIIGIYPSPVMTLPPVSLSISPSASPLDHCKISSPRLSVKGIYKDLKTWGFSFDIVVKGICPAGGNVEVVEINPFGARSGCGSCLFHWERDGSVLYGGKEGVEVRILI